MYELLWKKQALRHSTQDHMHVFNPYHGFSINPNNHN